ncbi:MAG: protoporphyrinogen oxidase [Myxococcota bacterium]|jgi:oxygen-dependent protoporphyrinogen oxidase|nr:protoporphyrinogen oxidase [Myxococcota bacterium]
MNSGGQAAQESSVPKIRALIVGAGISGLSTAYELSVLRPDWDIRVVEAESRAGGKALSDRLAGLGAGDYTVDAGPNGFLTNVPDAYELARELGLEVFSASDQARKRFIFVGGRLHAAPSSALAFFRSSLLPLRGKLRVAFEPFAARAPHGVDETVYAFARRRLGKAFADVLIMSMVQGVSAGDAREISLRSLFPRMWAMEREYGGLVAALLGKRWRQWRSHSLVSATERSGPAGPGGRLSTIAEGGIGALVEALSAHLGERLQLGAPLQSLRRADGLWECVVGGEKRQAEVLVLATPAYVSSALLQSLDAEAARLAGSIPYTPVAVVALGFDAEAFPQALDGFGFLVSPFEGCRIMGCLWTSSCFPQQAPAGKVLLRVLVGGSFAPNMLALDDERLLEEVLDALRFTMGLRASPEMHKLYRWPLGIPQYAPGHAALVEQLEERLSAFPGLALCSNGFGGIGVNDCVRRGRELARRLVAERERGRA